MKQPLIFSDLLIKKAGEQSRQFLLIRFHRELVVWN